MGEGDPINSFYKVYHSTLKIKVLGTPEKISL
jgi:hypothetical protein